jgi:hypothetical protein
MCCINRSFRGINQDVRTNIYNQPAKLSVWKGTNSYVHTDDSQMMWSSPGESQWFSARGTWNLLHINRNFHFFLIMRVWDPNSISELFLKAEKSGCNTTILLRECHTMQNMLKWVRLFPNPSGGLPNNKTEMMLKQRRHINHIRHCHLQPELRVNV